MTRSALLVGRTSRDSRMDIGGAQQLIGVRIAQDIRQGTHQVVPGRFGGLPDVATSLGCHIAQSFSQELQPEDLRLIRLDESDLVSVGHHGTGCGGIGPEGLKQLPEPAWFEPRRTCFTLRASILRNAGQIDEVATVIHELFHIVHEELAHQGPARAFAGCEARCVGLFF
jgi:hypothetical protein